MTNTTPDVGEQPWPQAFSAKDPEAIVKYPGRLNRGPLWYSALGLLG
jgi:hypothetical protein